MSALAFLGNLLGGSLVKDIGTAIHENITTDKERMALENEAKKAEYTYNTTLAQMDTDLAKGQIGVNLKEAESPNWFIAGARPAAMWVCVFGIAYQFIALPFLIWASVNFKWIVPPPLDVSTLNTLLFGMLGLGTMRTAEKFKGVHGDH